MCTWESNLRNTFEFSVKILCKKTEILLTGLRKCLSCHQIPDFLPGRYLFQFPAYRCIVHSFDETYQPKQRQERNMRSKQVTGQDPCSGGTQQSLVREAELHPEQQREIDGHTCQICIKAHEDVFPHKGRFSHYPVHCPEIKSS